MRYLKKKSVISFFVVLAVAIVLLHDGIGKYKNATNIYKEKFQTIEAEKVNQYILYTQLGGYGVKLLFLPNHLSIISDISFEKLTSTINSGEKLSIAQPMMSEIYSGRSSHYMSFIGIILLFFSSISLCYGADVLANKECLRLVSSFVNRNKLFILISCSRIFLLNFLLFVVFMVSLLWSMLNGLSLLNLQFFSIYLMASAINIFFFFVGVSLGAIKDKSLKTIFIISFYLLSVALIPFSINKIIEKRANKIQEPLDLSLKKLKLIMNVERDFVKKYGGLFKSGDTPTDFVKKTVIDALNTEYKKVHKLDSDLRAELSENARFYFFLSSLFPTSLFESFTNEISGSGYKAFIDFHRYTQELKRDFLKFYVDKKFFSKHLPGLVESFIKGDSNTYISKSYLPDMFFFGIIIFSLQLIGVTILSFYIYRKHVFIAPPINDIFKIGKGKCRVCLTSDMDYKDRIFACFKSNKNLLYFCNPDQIPPDYYVKHFVDFIHSLIGMPVKDYGIDNPNQYFQSLDTDSKIKTLLFLFGLDFDLFVFSSPESNDSIEIITDIVDKLKKASKAILYITNNLTLAGKIYDGDFIIPKETSNFQI